MDSLQKNTDAQVKQIDLTLPLLPEMVHIVRLTVSGIASRMGFQIDDIEDIKVAVAEICNQIILKICSATERFSIHFEMMEKCLKVRFAFEHLKPKDFKLFGEDDAFGMCIVNSLVDEVKLEENKDKKDIITLSMFLKEN
ncbi:MAG: hypothetical protein GX066_00220 [Clostridiaceae bacterium]|nr:hypothetical protein [Clostridiaceae bacterium]